MPRRNLRSAFTLIELVAVCAVLAILAAIAISAVGSQIQQARVAAENRVLDRLAAAIRLSFESTDLESTNLAAIAGNVPAGVDVTVFSVSNDINSIPATTNAPDWFAKVARQLGETPIIGTAPSAQAQPRVAAVLINPNRQTRLLWEGPENESGQQRFLLISLMAPAGTLYLPPWPNPASPQDPGNLALFNDTWNTTWSDPAATLPATWNQALPLQQILAWNGSNSVHRRLWQLCVRRIVCPKYNLVVNNTHPTDNCYLYYNLNGTTASASVAAAANSGTVVIPGIFAGRTIQAYRGTAPPPSAQLFSQFILRASSEVTLQD